jgi:hypothetical protein
MFHKLDERAQKPAQALALTKKCCTRTPFFKERAIYGTRERDRKEHPLVNLDGSYRLTRYALFIDIYALTHTSSG